MLLEVENLSLYYDRAMVLNGVSLRVDEGELVCLVGPNGAGKTSLLRAITGLVHWERAQYRGTRAGDIHLEGVVRFQGERIDHLPPHEIARRGLVHCPERRRPFGEMTVLENLRAGGFLCTNRHEFRRRLERVYQLFPRLKEREHQLASTLSGGEQQMLAIGRALMMEPKLLCIDEPTVGLAPQVAETLFEKIQEIHKSGVAVLLVEQDVHGAFAISTRNYVLSLGHVVAEGTSEELLGDETVRQAYLGM